MVTIAVAEETSLAQLAAIGQFSMTTWTSCNLTVWKSQ